MIAERPRPDAAWVGPRVVLVADDLTGAADSGVTFAAYGAKVLVVWDTASMTLSCAPFADVDVLVISTESRHGSSGDAVRRVRAVLGPLVALLCNTPAPFVYKKIDSTLRGHPGVELATVLQLFSPLLRRSGIREDHPLPQALVAPAFPAQGRVTRGGVHYVHGKPLAQTVFGQEVTSSRVQDFFTGDQERLRFADAETEADLGQCVDEALAAGLHVFCGSAGLADALAGRLAKAWGWTTRPNAATAPTASKRAVLVVAASRHPQTQRQLALLRVAGVPLLTPSPEWALSDDPGDDSALVMALAEGLASGVAILTTLGLPDLPTSGPVLVTRLARAAEAALSAVSRRAVAHAGVPSGGGLLSSEGLGLVLTGGDAAIAVSRALGAQALRLYGEVASGMPWGRLAGGHGAGLPVVTKAGGFGDPDALMTAIDFLRGVDDDCVLEIDGRRYGPILEKG